MKIIKSWLRRKRFRKHRATILERRQFLLDRLVDVRFEIFWLLSNREAPWFSSIGWATKAWYICQDRKLTGARWFDLNIFQSEIDRDIIINKAKEYKKEA